MDADSTPKVDGGTDDNLGKEFADVNSCLTGVAIVTDTVGVSLVAGLGLALTASISLVVRLDVVGELFPGEPEEFPP